MACHDYCYCCFLIGLGLLRVCILKLDGRIWLVGGWIFVMSLMLLVQLFVLLAISCLDFCVLYFHAWDGSRFVERFFVKATFFNCLAPIFRSSFV